MSLHAVAHRVPGTLRQEIEIDGRHHVATDEPERLGGNGTASSPHELLPAALAGCISTHLAMYARTKGWLLGDLAVDVDYDHRATPRRFEIEIRLGAALGDEQLTRLRAVSAACPVRKALSGGAEFNERILVGPDAQRAA